MSVINLQVVWEFLDMTHHGDDAKLQRLLDGAEDEALQFMDRDTLPRRQDSDEPISDSEPVSDGVDVAPSVVTAVCLLVQADYDQTGADAAATKDLAFRKLRPFRARMGF